MRIVRVFAALALMTALAGCGSSGQLQLAGLNWGQDTPPPPPGSGDMTSSPASASTEITGGTPAVVPVGPSRPSRTRCSAAIRATISCSASGTIARRTTASPSSISAAPWKRLPRDGEAWLGLAASYDRLKRYDLADRAYAKRSRSSGRARKSSTTSATRILLRGDLRRARQKFAEAQAKDPGNPTIANNIALVDEAARRRKGLN